jgi:TPR repeat protein
LAFWERRAKANTTPNVEGLLAIERGDLRDAFEIFMPLAQAGDAEAQCRIAFLYKSGVQDFNSAAAWYKRAADQGHAEAQCKLGFLYRSGRGVPLDNSEGARLYKLSAEQGYPEAQINLARCLQAGEGLPKDLAAAVKWFKRAVNSGDKRAAFELACLYLRNPGESADGKEVIHWLEIASDGSPSNYLSVGEIVDDGSSHDGVVLALSLLGKLYGGGNLVKADPEKSYSYHLRAAQLGDASSQCDLGYLLYTGSGTERDVNAAIEWLLKSSQQGNEQAKKNLGLMPEFLDSLSLQCPKCGQFVPSKKEHTCR